MSDLTPAGTRQHMTYIKKKIFIFRLPGLNEALVKSDPSDLSPTMASQNPGNAYKSGERASVCIFAFESIWWTAKSFLNTKAVWLHSGKAELWSKAEPGLLGSVLTCGKTWGLPNVWVALVPQCDLPGKM